MSATDNLTGKECATRLEPARESGRCQMDIEEAIADLKSYISKTKSDILKWQFGMWFAAMAIILAAIWRFSG